MTYMSSIEDPLRIAGSAPRLRLQGPPRRRRSLLARLIESLMEWQRRDEERAHILELDERLLRDIGTTREDLLHRLDGRG